MSSQATVQVRYVNQPKPGGKYGSIVDTGQNRYYIEPRYLSFFGVNEQTSITYETQNWQRGPANIVVAKNGINLPDLAAGRQQSAPMQTQPAPQPRTPEHDVKDLHIFICGVVQNAMRSGQFGVTDIRGLTLAAKEAWEEAMEGRVPAHVSQPHPGIGQEVPYKEWEAPSQPSGMDDGPPPGHPAAAGAPPF